MGTSVFDAEVDPITAARDAAAVTGAHVLLKGPGSVIASRRDELYINPTGGPVLAQGGTGDVLTGMMASLYAQQHAHGGDMSARLAAVAAWLHGRAGDLIERRIGPHPASASMLIDALPELLHEVAG